MNPCLTAVIFSLSFMTTSAYPLHRKSREATWANPQANQADDKTEVTKNVEKLYKSHIDSSDLYNQEDYNKNPIVEEMQRKLNMESERLRVRLRQELAELRERLSPSPSARERLAPLAQELQRSLGGIARDVCAQLGLYLRGLEAQAEAAPSLWREALDRTDRALERGGSEAAQSVSDFRAKAAEELRHLKEISVGETEGAESELWRETSSKLEQEVSSLQAEASNRVGALAALKAKLAAALRTERPREAQLTADVEQFCQSSILQDQAFQARLEGLFRGIQDTPSPSLASSGGSLTDDFTVQLSDLIQDILHSV